MEKELNNLFKEQKMEEFYFPTSNQSFSFNSPQASFRPIINISQGYKSAWEYTVNINDLKNSEYNMGKEKKIIYYKNEIQNLSTSRGVVIP